MEKVMTVRTSGPPRFNSLFELPFYQANLQFRSGFTGYFTDLVVGTANPYIKNYIYNFSTWYAIAGHCPIAYSVFKYIVS